MWPDLGTSAPRPAATCAVRVDGREIREFYGALSEVTVECDHRVWNEPCARLTFESRRDAAGVWSIQDAGIFSPWARITLEAVFETRRHELLRGFVREIRADYPARLDHASVSIECRDESLALDRRHVRTVWGAELPTDDATILTTVLTRHGLRLHPDSGRGTSPLILHQDSTDIRFLVTRAEANGYELIFEPGQVYFGPPRLDADPQPTLRVHAGHQTHCEHLTVTVDGHRPDRVIFDTPADEGATNVQEEVAPDLPLLGQSSLDSSAMGLDVFAWRLEGQGTNDPAQLRARAQGRVNDMAMKTRAEGTLDGALYGRVLEVGKPVEVDGVGPGLGGLYYVVRVRHRFSTTGYRQDFVLVRNASNGIPRTSGHPLAAIL